MVKSSLILLGPCSKRTMRPEDHKANKVSTIIASDYLHEFSSLGRGKEKIKKGEGSRQKRYPIKYVVDCG